MHSSRMRTARFSCYRGGCLPGGVSAWGVSDRCKNITLPQTSFAGGQNYAVAVAVWTVSYSKFA